MSASPALPPFNNMGALITSPHEAPKENQVLIDWLSWTLKTVDPDEAIKQSGLAAIPFKITNGGGMGYKQSMRSGNIVVFFDGNPGMGCHISMTGQGCRQYETYKNKKSCWYDLLHTINASSGTVTRCDVALDNVDGALNLESLQAAIENKQVRTRFKSGQIIQGIDFTDVSSYF